MKKTLLCLVLVVLATSASAQTLWRDAAVGATPEQVRTLMPEVRETSAELRAAEPGRLLEIAQYELSGARFNVAFDFEGDQLKSISLLADTGSADEARALAQRLTTSLRSRYGLEMSTRSRGSTSSVTIDRQWNFRRTVVHLQVMDARFVRLDYSGQPPVRNSRL